MRKKPWSECSHTVLLAAGIWSLSKWEDWAEPLSCSVTGLAVNHMAVTSACPYQQRQGGRQTLTHTDSRMQTETGI